MAATLNLASRRTFPPAVGLSLATVACSAEADQQTNAFPMDLQILTLS